MPDRIGQILGNYRLIGLLGRGGFAEVYLGEHRRLGTQAAIKVLYAHVANAEENDFLTEARTLAHLEHPHIIRILDFDVQDGTPFIVMGLAPNGTLRQRHPKGTILPLTTVIDYVSQITAALQYAHDQKIIHRDIKPENMLLGRHQEVLLSDFGIALLAQSSRLQSMQTVVGTVAYMAPEQLQGKPQIASDQYALGVVVYEWLSGERPFQGTFLELYSQHLSVPPPLLSSKNAAIAPEIDGVLQTALAKEPARRFGSIKAFVTALEQASASHVSPSRKLLAQTPSTPPPSPSYSRIVSPIASPHSVITEGHAVPKSPLAQPLSVAPALNPSLIPLEKRNNLVLPAPQADQSIPPIPPRKQAQKQIKVKRSPKQAKMQGLSKKQRISRRTVLGFITGFTSIAIAGGGGTWLYLSKNPLEGTTVLTYTEHSDSVNAVAWSPNSQQIASGSDDKTVQIWNARDGSSSYIYTKHKGAIFAVAWSPDNIWIASGSDDKTVQIWNARDGSSPYINSPYIYTKHKGPVYAVAWSPDGKFLASAGTDKTVQVWNARDGNSSYIYKGHTGTVNAVAWSPDSKFLASAGTDKTVQVWNAHDGSSSYIYKGHTDAVNAISWSPNGQYIASASNDQTVQVWNAHDGYSLYTYREQTSAVYAVDWSPDGQQLVSADDITVQIWNVQNGNTLYTYTGHHYSPVHTIDWSPDSQYIASAGYYDNTVQIWKS